MTKTRNIAILLILSFVLGLSGCAGLSGPSAEFDQAWSWPPPPAPARIEWVRDIREPGDYGIAKGFWRRVVEAFTSERTRGIVRPYGVFADARERLFVVDTGAAVVHVMDRGNQRHTALRGPEKGGFLAPIGVAEDDRDILYITDSAAGKVYRYDLEKEDLRVFAPGLMRPTGIAFSHRNRLLYVTDTLAHQVVAFGLDGVERFRIGSRGTGPVQFSFPTDLFVDRRGQLYVTDALNHRVQVLTPEGQSLALIGQAGDSAGRFDKPKGVAVDSSGHIYVADAMQDAVQIFDHSGRLLLAFGGTGSRPGEFWIPSGLFIDDRDNLYVSDSYNRRVQMFRIVESAGGR